MVKSKKVVEEKRVESVKKIPIGVQIISILHYVFTGIFTLIGLFMIIGANAILSVLVNYAPDLGSTLTSGVFIVVGIISIGIGILAFFVGRGLWKLKSWARIFAIVLSILWSVDLIYYIITNFAFMQIVWLLISGYIWIYLVFSKEAKKAFK